MINMLVDRCHVSASYMTVIRYVISRMKDGYKTYSAQERTDRRILLELIIARHKENRGLYDQVMKGAHTSTHARRNPYQPEGKGY